MPAAFATSWRGASGAALVLWLAALYAMALGVGRISRGVGLRLRRGIDAHGARLVAGHCRRHGALLIKVAQWVASRPDLLPLAYVDACAPLRDQAPARGWASVERQLDRAFERRWRDHFPEFERTPIAAASFGQVHRARLRDGTAVAVKVQHEGLAPLVRMDLRITGLALFLLRPLAPGWPLDVVHREIARVSTEEQDYLIEGRAATRLAPVVARHGIGVPEVYWEHTRDTVLTTRFIAGPTLAQLDVEALAPAVREDIAGTIIDAYLDQLIEEGFFHGDPHAGNLIWDGAKLWLIDFGMTDQIGPRERAAYRRFVVALKQEDTDGMVDSLVSIGILTAGADAESMKDIAREVFAEFKDISLHSFKGSKREAELSQKVGTFVRRIRGLVLPHHTILLLRALSLVEGVCLQLVPGKNMLQIIRPRLSRLVSPWAVLKDQAQRLRARIDAVLDLPADLQRLLAPRREPVGGALAAVLAAILLLVAVQLPDGPLRLVAAVAAGIAVIAALRR